MTRSLLTSSGDPDLPRVPHTHQAGVVFARGPGGELEDVEGLGRVPQDIVVVSIFSSFFVYIFFFREVLPFFFLLSFSPRLNASPFHPAPAHAFTSFFPFLSLRLFESCRMPTHPTLLRPQ